MAHLQMDNGITLNRLLWRAYCTRVASKLSNDFCFCLKLTVKYHQNSSLQLYETSPDYSKFATLILWGTFAKSQCEVQNPQDFFHKMAHPNCTDHDDALWMFINAFSKTSNNGLMLSLPTVEIIWQERFNLDQVLSKALEKSKLDRRHLKVECLVPKSRWWYGFQGDLYRFYVSSKGNDFQMDTCHCCLQERT